jgi:hypothetical protein
VARSQPCKEDGRSAPASSTLCTRAAKSESGDTQASSFSTPKPLEFSSKASLSLKPASSVVRCPLGGRRCSASASRTKACSRLADSSRGTTAGGTGETKSQQTGSVAAVSAGHGAHVPAVVRSRTQSPSCSEKCPASSRVSTATRPLEVAIKTASGCSCRRRRSTAAAAMRSHSLAHELRMWTRVQGLRSAPWRTQITSQKGCNHLPRPGGGIWPGVQASAYDESSVTLRITDVTLECAGQARASSRLAANAEKGSAI